MSDAPAPADPWPIPSGTLLSDEARLCLEDASVAVRTFGPELLALIEGRPVPKAPEHEAYVHDLAVAIDALESIADEAKQVQAEAVAALARAVPYEVSNVTFGDTRPMTIRRGGERKGWRNDLLVDDVRPRVLADENGEARSGQDVYETLVSVVSITGNNAKMTGLRKLGLDPDDYCLKDPKPPTIQIAK